MQKPSRDEYLEQEVRTASPEKLQLLLIEAAIRRCQRAQQHWLQNEDEQAGEAILESARNHIALAGGLNCGCRLSAGEARGGGLRVHGPLANQSASRARRTIAARHAPHPGNRTRNLAAGLPKIGQQPPSHRAGSTPLRPAQKRAKLHAFIGLLLVRLIKCWSSARCPFAVIQRFAHDFAHKLSSIFLGTATDNVG